MENIDSVREKSIVAAQEYLNAKRNMLPATVFYVYRNTYNYLMTVIKRYV